jgi:uncharacterized protein (DUF1800 family)
MADSSSVFGSALKGRRSFLVSAALAGLGALVAVDVAKSAATTGGGGSDVRFTDDVKLNHLLRRAGFGASPAELAQYQQLGLAGTVERLINYEHVDNSALDQRLSQSNFDLTKRADIGRWWTTRMVYTARPLEEKMTLFWHGLLTSAISKVHFPQAMIAQNQFLRANALGQFPDILKGISRDPAMMIWLDTSSNKKGHPNENYARELMELFSLGVGNYTEQDVREGARAFTGWSLQGQPKQGNFSYIFRPLLHDDGEKTFLGQTGNFDGDDVVDIIVKQPASARFIANKLFSFFAYPHPTDDVLAPLVQTYVASNYSIKALVRAILTSDEFYSPRAYRALVKSPVEYVVGTMRALGLDTSALGLPLAMTQMGQELFNPPNVAGWPGGPAWLASGTWISRLNFANAVASALGQPPRLLGNLGGQSAIDVNGLLGSATAPADVVARLTSLFLDGQISAPQSDVLVDYLTPPAGGSLASTARAWADERRRGALYLTLAMPEYHLA